MCNKAPRGWGQPAPRAYRLQDRDAKVVHAVRVLCGRGAQDGAQADRDDRVRLDERTPARIAVRDVADRASRAAAPRW